MYHVTLLDITNVNITCLRYSSSDNKLRETTGFLPDKVFIEILVQVHQLYRENFPVTKSWASTILYYLF